MTPAQLCLVAQARADLASGVARACRQAAGISMAEAAAALGVSRQAVSYWESGRSAPSAANALAYIRLVRQLARRAA